MLNQVVVDILIRRIRQGWINPETGEPLKVEDIKKDDYKQAVLEVLNQASTNE